MSRFQIYLQTASRLIREHGGGEPFSLFLKRYFSQDKKYGSRDRKAISSIAYCYYRAGHALGPDPNADSLLHALFLCGNDGNGTLLQQAPALYQQINLTTAERLQFLGLKASALCPYHPFLSDQVNSESYCLSLLEQPDLFLRIRPGKRDVVMSKLSGANLPFESLGNDTLRLPNQSPVDSILNMNREAVVQDYSSQRVLHYLSDLGNGFSGKMISAWDCCAASGGKAILLHDILGGHVQITLSDIRDSILANAGKRLRESGVPIQDSFVADLTRMDAVPGARQWPLVLADMPCTGSGTWARTPEQSYYFDGQKIREYAERQAKILHSVAGHLQPGGWMFYITCSVFSAENENLLTYALPGTGLRVISSEYLTGMDHKADSMFVAVLTH